MDSDQQGRWIVIWHHAALVPHVSRSGGKGLAPWVPPRSDSVVALFSTHLFHLRERKALLVAYPSTSATLSVGEWAAQWPQADATYDRARLLSLVSNERCAPLCTSISP